MITKKYNKLIRDKILNFIRDADEKPFFKTLRKKEYLKEIKKKIIEEGNELIKARGRGEVINEIVDIQELIDCLIKELKLTKLQIKRKQKEKNKKRGGFKKKLFLIKTVVLN